MSSALAVEAATRSAASVDGQREIRVVAASSSAASAVSPRGSSETLGSSSAYSNADPTWMPALIGRLGELNAAPNGWDSYGGHSLRTVALEQFAAFYVEYKPTMQSPPSLSLTPTGGLHAWWKSRDGELEIIFEGVSSPEVLFGNPLTASENSGTVEDFAQVLSKWIWRSSMVV